MEEDRFDEKNQGLNEGYTGAGQEQDTPAVDSYGQGEAGYGADSHAAEDHSHFGEQPQWQPPEPPAPPASQEWQASEAQGPAYEAGPEQPGYTYGYSPAGGGYGEPPKPPKKHKAGKVLGLIAVIVASVMVGALVGVYVVYPLLNTGNRDSLTVPAPSPSASQSAAPEASGDKNVTIGGNNVNIQDANNPIPEIVETLSPSVVGVAAQTVQETVEGKVRNISRGTGFVISDDGYILTNYHVLSGSTDITVTTQDGKEYPATYLGGDSTRDVAVVKVENAGLKAMPIGSSSQLKAGQQVIAIGNPAGAGENLVGTVTVGYVSAVNRELMFNGTRQKFIQTDAAINPGNSGGPLVDINGNVVGMITLKSLVSTSTVDAEGIGFAIPIDSAVEMAKEIIENGSIKKPGLGIWYGTLTEEARQQAGLPAGPVVQGFMENSPAEAAGMQEGDVIIKYEGEELGDRNMADLIAEKKVGDKVNISVWRDGKEIDLEITLGDINTMN